MRKAVLLAGLMALAAPRQEALADSDYGPAIPPIGQRGIVVEDSFGCPTLDERDAVAGASIENDTYGEKQALARCHAVAAGEEGLVLDLSVMHGATLVRLDGAPEMPLWIAGDLGKVVVAERSAPAAAEKAREARERAKITASVAGGIKEMLRKEEAEWTRISGAHPRWWVLDLTERHLVCKEATPSPVAIADKVRAQHPSETIYPNHSDPEGNGAWLELNWANDTAELEFFSNRGDCQDEARKPWLAHSR